MRPGPSPYAEAMRSFPSFLPSSALRPTFLRSFVLPSSVRPSFLRPSFLRPSLLPPFHPRRPFPPPFFPSSSVVRPPFPPAIAPAAPVPPHGLQLNFQLCFGQHRRQHGAREAARLWSDDLPRGCCDCCDCCLLPARIERRLDETRRPMRDDHTQRTGRLELSESRTQRLWIYRASPPGMVSGTKGAEIGHPPVPAGHPSVPATRPPTPTLPRGCAGGTSGYLFVDRSGRPASSTFRRPGCACAVDLPHARDRCMAVTQSSVPPTAAACRRMADGHFAGWDIWMSWRHGHGGSRNWMSTFPGGMDMADSVIGDACQGHPCLAWQDNPPLIGVSRVCSQKSSWDFATTSRH